MKKLLILFLMLSALLIASCGGSGNGDSTGDNGDSGSSGGDNGDSGSSGGDNGDSGSSGGDTGVISENCGNRVQDAGEVCDGGATECKLIDPGYTGGYAVCKANCTGWDTSACQGTATNTTDPTDPTNPNENPTDPDDNGTGSTGDNSDPREDADVTYIHLNGTSITVDGANPDDVTVSGSTATITASGVFEIDGTLSNGGIVVDVDKTKDSEVVHVVLNGASITSSNSSPFMVNGAKDVRIFTAKGSQNTLSDGSNYTIPTDDPADQDAAAALYSKADLILAGEGSLTVNGNCNDGISSKDDLDIDGGTVVITAKDDGIRGKDSLVIRGGDIYVTSGGDGIKSDSTEALELSNNADDPYENIKGYIKIKGGKVTVNATNGDGIHAISYIKIENNPTIDITSGGGSVITTSSSGGGWGGGGPGSSAGQKYEGDTSLKGIKASIPETVTNYATLNETVTTIKIHGGKIKINSRDDGIHSGGNIEVKGGEIEIASDDDGVHADYTLLMINGSINVTMSYEGLEAQFLTINGGITSVYGRDDGWNAAGGSDGSGMGGGPGQGGPGGGGPGGGGFGSSSGTLTLTGGIHYVKTGSGDVDGIDSNGALTISDQAVIVVECQISGGMGGSYDADGTTNLTSPWILGFTPSQQSERGQNYNVSFNTNGIYGNQKIAFQPTFSGNRMQSSSGQPSMINDISSYTAQTMPNGVVIYYK